MQRLGATLLVLLFATTSQAATIQARLIRATTEPTSTDDRLKDIQPQLQKVFGYPNYQQRGEKKATLKASGRLKFDLGEGFVLFVTPKSIEDKTHELDVGWFSGKTMLVKTTVKIPEKNSIFIKGPAVGEDWIVLALTVLE